MKINNNHHDPNKIRAFLDEDAPDDAAALEPVIRKLRHLDGPVATVSQKRQFTAMLIREHQAMHTTRRFDPREWWPMLLLQSQLRVVEANIWLASALVMALGGIVTLTLDPTASREGLPFALIAPLIAAVGIAFLYSPDNEPVMEIERGTPASMRLIWLARITLVFGFDMLLGVVASLIMSLVHPSISAWSLVMMWLAPMALLSALAFLISIHRGDPLIGTFVSLMLWCVQVLKHLIPHGLFWIDRVPNLLAVETRLWTFALALLLLGLALWLIGRMTDQPTLRTE